MTRCIISFVGIISLLASAQTPNPRLTPGAVRPTTKEALCSPKFRTDAYRHTSLALKKKVCRAYGIAKCPSRTMEIDHLVPLELGGADVEANLWPEYARYADGSPGFHDKDVLENALKRQLCAGSMSLMEAQKAVVRPRNWKKEHK